MSIRRSFMFNLGSVPPYEPEVMAMMDFEGVLNDDTLYFVGTPQENTGAYYWELWESFVVSTKTLFGLPLKVWSLDQFFPVFLPRFSDNAVSAGYNLSSGLVDCTYFGGWTHEPSGSTPNGVNAYAEIDYDYTIPTNFRQNSTTFSFRSLTNIAETRVDLGVLTGGYANILLYTRSASDLLISRLNTAGGNNSMANTNSKGLITLRRNASANYKADRDGTTLGTITENSANTFTTTYKIFLASFNNTGTVGGQYSTKKRTIDYCGAGIADADLASWDNIVDTLETGMNRIT